MLILAYYRCYGISDEAVQDFDGRFGYVCTGLEIGACINRNTVDGQKSCMTLRTLNYGNYGMLLIMGHAGFCPSTVGFRAHVLYL